MKSNYSEAILREAINKNYKISPIEECSLIRKSFNDHYLIKTTEDKYVLRVYYNEKYYINDTDDFRLELEMLDYLVTNKLSVVKPIQNSKNQLLSEETIGDETKYIALFEFVEGKALEMSLDMNTSMDFGAQIGRMHNLFDNFSGENNRYTIDEHFLVKEPLDLLLFNINKYNLEISDQIIEYYMKLLDKLKGMKKDKCSWGLIHGDLNPSNIHVDGSKKITFLDFDHLAKGYRIHDLAVTKLCFEKNTYERILQAYAGVRSLSQYEKDLIEPYSLALVLRKYKDVISINETEGIADAFDTFKYTKETITYL